MANDLSIQPEGSAYGTTSAGRGVLFLNTAAQFPPVVSNVYPAANTVITSTQNISFDITTADGLGFQNIIVWVEYPDRRTTEMVYADGVFAYNFTGNLQDIAFGKRFTFRRTGGFLAAPLMKIQATTTSGGVN